MPAETMIQCEALTKRFGQFTAVDHVSFSVAKGSIFGFLGPNGSGKSTVIRMLCGLLEPSDGYGRIAGFDVVRQTEQIKHLLGYMSQKFSLYDELTVHENLTFYSRLYGLRGAALARRREELIALTHLAPYLDRRAGLLSGGWRQRLAMACSLVHRPDVLFLDEPTAGIDPVARRELWDLLFELSGQGTSFLVTTHYMDEAERCSDVGYLYLSKLIVCGDPGELRNLPAARPENTRWLQIETEHSTRAYVLLRDAPHVVRATIFGAALHLLVDESASDDDITRPLREAGITVHRVLEVEPSLEDVFVALTEQEAEKRRLAKA